MNFCQSYKKLIDFCIGSFLMLAFCQCIARSQQTIELHEKDVVVFERGRVLGVNVDEKTQTLDRIYVLYEDRLTAYDSNKSPVFEVQGRIHEVHVSPNGNYVFASIGIKQVSKQENGLIKHDLLDKNGNKYWSREEELIYDVGASWFFISDSGLVVEVDALSRVTITEKRGEVKKILEVDGDRSEDAVRVAFSKDCSQFVLSYTDVDGTEDVSTVFLVTSSGDFVWTSPRLAYAVNGVAISDEARYIAYYRANIEGAENGHLRYERIKSFSTYIVNISSDISAEYLSEKGFSGTRGMEFVDERFLKLWGKRQAVLYDVHQGRELCFIQIEAGRFICDAKVLWNDFLVLLQAVETETEVPTVRRPPPKYSDYELAFYNIFNQKLQSKHAIITDSRAILSGLPELRSYRDALFVILPSRVIVYRISF